MTLDKILLSFDHKSAVDQRFVDDGNEKVEVQLNLASLIYEIAL